MTYIYVIHSQWVKTQVTLGNMATSKTDTGISWEVAFDFDCEPNSFSALLSGQVCGRCMTRI